MWPAACGWAMLVQGRDYEGQERTVEVTEQGDRTSIDREPVLDTDDGGGQAAVPEGRVFVCQGPRPLIDVWVVHCRPQLAAEKAETARSHFWPSEWSGRGKGRGLIWASVRFRDDGKNCQAPK